MSPLRIAVCLPQVPFERGGAEVLADGLVKALTRRGHEADLITLPFKWYPNVALLQSALAWRMADLTEANGRRIDLVIATKFPSYLIRHPRKVVWLVHQFRQAYDLHGTDLGQFDEDREGLAMRRAIREMDDTALREAAALFAISGNVRSRLRRDNGLDSRVLTPPPQELPEVPEGDDGYLLSVGRLDATKRVDLILEAMALAPAARLVVVGAGQEEARLRALARRLQLDGRAEFRGRVERDELATLYRRCRAVVYVPRDEDYGLVAVEAGRAGKPVVTTHDSGGPLEILRDGESGLVADPEPGSLAAAMRRLAEDGALAGRMGEAGRTAVREINWDTVVDRILEGAGA